MGEEITLCYANLMQNYRKINEMLCNIYRCSYDTYGQHTNQEQVWFQQGCFPWQQSDRGEGALFLSVCSCSHVIIVPNIIVDTTLGQSLV